MTEKIKTNISEISLNYKRKVKASNRPKVSSSKDAEQLFRENWNDLTINLFEEFKILLLDRNNACIGIVPISQGGVSGTLVDAKLLFASALKARACAIILGHNHPSGNLKPSQSDLTLTKKLIEGASYLDLKILDHLILSDTGYTSFADNNLVSFTL
ncbi:MAG: JAB domain-containing protein [Bacteroidota bacterium]